MAIFPGKPGLASFSDDGNGGENYSYVVQSPAKSSPPTNQHLNFLQALPVAQPQCQSTEEQLSVILALPINFKLYVAISTQWKSGH